MSKNAARPRERMISARERAERNRSPDEVDLELNADTLRLLLAPDDLNHVPLNIDHWCVFPSLPVVHYVRSSDDKSVSLGRRDRDESETRVAILSRGFIIERTIRCVEDSRLTEPRPMLEKAFRIANRIDGIVVTSTRDRFLRGRAFDGKHRSTESPDDDDYRMLRNKAQWVGYAVIGDPEKQGRSVQTKRGLAATEKTIGRPVGSRNRVKGNNAQEAKWFDTVIDLHVRGLSLRAIEHETGVDHSTIRRWIIKWRSQSEEGSY